MAREEAIKPKVNLTKKIFWRITFLLSLLIILSSMLICVSAIQMNRNDFKAKSKAEAFFLGKQTTKLISWDDRIAVMEILENALAVNVYLKYAFVERNAKLYVAAPVSHIPPELLSGSSSTSSQNAIREFRDRNASVFYDIAIGVQSEKAVVHVGLDRAMVDRNVWGKLIRTFLKNMTEKCLRKSRKIKH